jgi:dinuclear metal center YbgI/SA1388 family protein
MNTVKDIFEKLCEIAPLGLQLEYDNAGFLIGRAEAPVEKALLSLDVTAEVAEEAIERGAQLIVSHHPIVWDAMKSVTDCTPGNEKLLRLIENGIAVISMHTNLDIAEGGVNDVLISLLGAKNEGPFDEEGCGRKGSLEKPISMSAFLSVCKEKLNTNGLRYHDAGRAVEHIAVLGGSGGGNLIGAWKAGCDTYVTADVKYSVFLQARELGVNLIDGDHFCTENPVIPVVAEKLRKAFPETEFLLSKRHDQTARFF